jgi:hypothetical protein
MTWHLGLEVATLHSREMQPCYSVYSLRCMSCRLDAQIYRQPYYTTSLVRMDSGDDKIGSCLLLRMTSIM